MKLQKDFRDVFIEWDEIREIDAFESGHPKLQAIAQRAALEITWAWIFQNIPIT